MNTKNISKEIISVFVLVCDGNGSCKICESRHDSSARRKNVYRI